MCRGHAARSVPSRAAALRLVVAAALLATPAGLLAQTDSQGLAPDAVAGEDSEGLTLATEPERIILGEVEEVKLDIVVRNPSDDDRPLRGSVNVGVLGDVVQVAPGRYAASYTPPAARFPQVAIVALWRESGPDAPVAFFRVPLRGTARVPFRTRRGAEVTVDVDGETFGPFQAGRDGRAEARLVVPPGVAHATLTAVTGDGETTSQRLELGVPPYNRLTLAVVPHAAVADGVSPVRLHLYYDVRGRRAPSADRLRIAAPVGTTGTMVHHGGPLYGATFTAPPGTPDRPVTFEATVLGDDASTAQATIALGRQRPARLDLMAQARQVVADGEATVEFELSVRDALGLGVGGLSIQPAIDPAGALDALPEITDAGGGHYRFAVSPSLRQPQAGPQAVTITVEAEGVTDRARLEIVPWVPARVELGREALALSADGRSTAVLDVRAFDAQGRPMDHLEPEVSIRTGRLHPVTALDDGGYRVRYTAPVWTYDAFRRRGPAPTREEVLRVDVGGVTSEAVVRLTAQAEDTALPRVFLEAGGGYRSNLGILAGPGAFVHAGGFVMHRPRISLLGGVHAGLADQRGGWAVAGFDEDSGWARVRLTTVPILATFGLEIPAGGWRVGAGLGGGVMLAPGSVRVPRGGEVSVSATVPAAAGRLVLGRRVGPGYLMMEGTYLYAEQTRHRGGVDVTGSLGGVGAAVGYRVER